MRYAFIDEQQTLGALIETDPEATTPVSSFAEVADAAEPDDEEDSSDEKEKSDAESEIMDHQEEEIEEFDPDEEYDDDACVFETSGGSFDDDTNKPDVPKPIAPAGYTIENCPETFPLMSTLVHRRILWAIDICKDGNSGWIQCEIFGGPPDPARAAQGITVQLRCNRRVDANTPDYLLKDRAHVAFSIENYGILWCLLKAK